MRPLSQSPTNRGYSHQSSSSSSRQLIAFNSGILIGFVVSSLLWSLHVFSTVPSNKAISSLQSQTQGQYQSYGISSALGRLMVPSSSTTTSTSARTNMMRSVSSRTKDTADTTRNTQNSHQKKDGWSTVHVFYGNSDLITQDSAIPSGYFGENKWFSQFRQDEIVSRLLRGKRNGYFVDLAANDAVRISNTYALESQFGWTGLCLEPNERYWPGLAYRTCTVVGAVVGNTTMDQVAFKFPKEKAPKGGIVGKEFDNHEVGEKGETRQRYTVTLKDIFERFDTPKVIDYLSLDVEGAELFIMSYFPFSEYRIQILTVERPNTELSKLLEKEGYVLLKTLHANTETLWVHESALDDDSDSTLDQQALKEINTEQYKYREGKAQERIAPEEQ